MLHGIQANIRDFYERMYWAVPDAKVERGEGYVLSYSGKSWLSGANQLWLDDPRVFGVSLLDYSVRFFRPVMAEWTIFVMPELFPELKAHIMRLGGYVRWSNPVMLLQGRPHVETVAAEAEIDGVRGYFLRNLARNVMGEAFHMENSINRNMVRAEHDDDPHVHHYLAYFQAHPGAAATMTYTDGMAGIWNVGTRRMFRRRGLAQALMARMLSDAAAAGYDRSMLLASNQGRPLYRKLGYEIVAQAFYMGVAPY